MAIVLTTIRYKARVLHHLYQIAKA